ncbi:hypothetical protein IAT38_000746 [Cryptococcus sp. DSM 104549]
MDGGGIWTLVARLVPCGCGPRKSDDPEREPIFPHPNTVLTPPRPRPNLPSLSATAGHYGSGSGPSSPSKSTAGLSAWGSAAGTVGERRGQRERSRMDSISKAFAGRMHSLNPNVSLPPTPGSPTHTIQPLSTTPAPPPGPSRIPTHPSQAHTTPSSPSKAPPQPGAGTQPVPAHRGPGYHLGRSASEPRSLFDMAGGRALMSMRTVDNEVDGDDGGFAPHQMPRYGAVVAERGRSAQRLGGRTRSATVVDRARAAGASPGEGFEPWREGKRGVPGFDVVPPSENNAGDHEGEGERPSFARSVSDPSPSPQAYEHEVVRRELGLSVLASGSGALRGGRGRGRGKGKGRPGRGGGSGGGGVGRVASG